MKPCRYNLYQVKLKVMVQCSRYRPGVAQRVGRGIALLFRDRGTRRGWVVSSTPRPHFTPGIDQVPVVQEAGWAPGPVWTGGKSRPYRDSIPARPARIQSLYRLSYPELTPTTIAFSTRTDRSKTTLNKIHFSGCVRLNLKKVFLKTHFRNFTYGASFYNVMPKYRAV